MVGTRLSVALNYGTKHAFFSATKPIMPHYIQARHIGAVMYHTYAITNSLTEIAK